LSFSWGRIRTNNNALGRGGKKGGKKYQTPRYLGTLNPTSQNGEMNGAHTEIGETKKRYYPVVDSEKNGHKFTKDTEFV